MITPAGTYVRIRYILRLESGEIVKGDPSDSLACMDFVTGFEQILPGLESRLVGLEQGDRVTIRVPPEEAFGPYDHALVKERSFAEFPEGRSLEEGKWVLAANDAHKIMAGYFVKKKGPDSITVDYNHPLAGKPLIYEVSISEVRPARQQELALIKPCDFEPGARYTVVETRLGEDQPEDDR